MITPALRIKKAPKLKMSNKSTEGFPSEARNRAHKDGKSKRRVPV